MPKTVACIVVRSPKLFVQLGHLPLMAWSLEQLPEVRGISQIVCVASPALVGKAAKLTASKQIEAVAMPPAVVTGGDDVLDAWLTGAGGPAQDADVVVVVKPTSPFLPAAKIEACLAQVVRKRCSTCVPARDVSVVTPGRRATKGHECVAGVRVFRVGAVAELRYNTVAVSLIESLDADQPDEYVVAAALAESEKV